MINLKILLLAILLFTSKEAFTAGISSKYMNIIADDSLYYPLNLLIDKFILNSNLIINVKYTNEDFYKHLDGDNRINIFITKKDNRRYIENIFNIKSDIFFGNGVHCLCVNRDNQEIDYGDSSNLKSLLKNNKFNNAAVGSSKSSFSLDKDLGFTSVTEFDNSMDAMQSLYFKKSDIGIFLYQMCVVEKKFKPIHVLNISDVLNTNIMHLMPEYRIIVVNYLNNDVQSFIYFFNNAEYIYDLLKDYGIINKIRQFSHK